MTGGRGLERRDRILDLILGASYFVGFGLAGLALGATLIRGL
jgi:hypothetical protein